MVANTLARKCHAYLSSVEFKERILKSISKKFSLQPMVYLYEKVSHEVENWCGGNVVEAAINQIDCEIKSCSNELETEELRFIHSTTGETDHQFQETEFGLDGVFLRRVPKAVLFQITTLFRIKWLFSSTSSREERLQYFFKGLMDSYSIDILEQSFKNLFELYFCPKINHLMNTFVRKYDAMKMILEAHAMSELTDEEVGNLKTVADDLDKISDGLVSLKSAISEIQLRPQ